MRCVVFVAKGSADGPEQRIRIETLHPWQKICHVGKRMAACSSNQLLGETSIVHTSARQKSEKVTCRDHGDA